MSFWALLDKQESLVVGDEDPFQGLNLVSTSREPLEAYQNKLPYAKGRLLRLVEMIPKAVR
jgi:hypothetical protein